MTSNLGSIVQASPVSGLSGLLTLSSVVGILTALLGFGVALYMLRSTRSRADDRHAVRLDLKDGTVVRLESKDALTSPVVAEKLEESLVALQTLTEQERSSRQEAPSSKAVPPISTLDGVIAIQLGDRSAHDLDIVADEFRRSHVLALGMPAGDATPTGGTESDLLHFTIDSPDGKERVMLPIFSQTTVLRQALLRNPDWQKLMVLEIAGDELLKKADDDVTIILNPWSRLEYEIPVADVRAHLPSFQ